MMNKFRKYILALLLLVVTIAPRLPRLNSFVGLDEPAWLTRGGNFYYALGQREFQNTVYEYHPSVLTMWFVTAALLRYFPEYRGLGQGYFVVDKNKFDPFLLEHGKTPIQLLFLSRVFQVVVILLFILIIFYLLSRLIGESKAFLIAAFASSSPYFLGHSRLLSHEAMVAVFVLASVFGMIAYLEYERKWYFFLISAASAALAQLTKSSAMAMFPVIALVMAVSLFEKTRGRGFKSAFLDHLKVAAAWFAVLVFVYFIVWPGMWVAPGKMLFEVYGNAFSYAFQGARLEVTQELQPSRFNIDALGSSFVYFVTNILQHGTIAAWLGMLFAAASLLLHGKSAPSTIEKKLMLYLFITAAAFILLFSVAQGKNSAHYIMTSYVSMDAVAALGWGAWLGWLAMKWETGNRLRVRAGGAALLVILQLASALAFYPYYYTYYNPIMTAFTGSVPTSDYGEGFEQAAAYLAQKPNSETLKVFVFRARGAFSFFFPGETIVLNPLFMEEPGMGSAAERIVQADYLVINEAFRYRTERTALFMQGLNGVRPEHTIQIKGISTIYIYRVADLPSSFYDVFKK